MRGRQREKNLPGDVFESQNKFLREFGRHLFYFQNCFQYFMTGLLFLPRVRFMFLVDLNGLGKRWQLVKVRLYLHFKCKSNTVIHPFLDDQSM